jgi:hypothetical protein
LKEQTSFCLCLKLILILAYETMMQTLKVVLELFLYLKTSILILENTYFLNSMYYINILNVTTIRLACCIQISITKLNCYTCEMRECCSKVVKALCYKLGDRRFKTRWGEWIFSIYLILDSEVYSASTRNEY